MDFEKAFCEDDYSVQVSIEQLINKAKEIESIYVDLIYQIKEVEKCISDLPGYWDSESSILLIELFEQDRKDAKNIDFKIRKQIEKLDLIITKYSETEEINQKEMETLPEGIIS